MSSRERTRRREGSPKSLRSRSRSPLSQPRSLRSRSVVEQTTSSPVYLLREKAHGRAGVGLESNQLVFMKLMGLTDPESAQCECSGPAEWKCLLSQEAAEILVTASRHLFFENIQREGYNDGLLFDDHLSVAVGVQAEQVPQCQCVAHECLKQDLSDSEADDLKTIIRSATLKSVDAGSNYACALLRRLFTYMGMGRFKAERSGGDFGVSYLLMCDNKRYCFRGFPDFIIHKEDIGAGRILVCTGEIQSTNNPALQNSIYGIGSHGSRPILCLTIFKNKMAQLLVARLSTTQLQLENETVQGAVSLKYVVNPSPLDLKTVEGVQSLATRLYYMLAR